jgi:O-antigen ligase
LFLAAVVGTGSKTGLAALIITGTLVLVISVRQGHAFHHRFIAAGAVIMVGLGATVVYLVSSDVWEVGRYTLASRVRVWELALAEMADHPVLGLGFGGWERWIGRTFALHGTLAEYPLHNLLLIAWSWTGITGALLAGAFLVSAVLNAWFAQTHTPATHPLRARALSLVFLWLLIQSMFTNAALTDIRIGLPIALALAQLRHVIPRPRTTQPALPQTATAT